MTEQEALDQTKKNVVFGDYEINGCSLDDYTLCSKTNGLELAKAIETVDCWRA